MFSLSQQTKHGAALPPYPEEVQAILDLLPTTATDLEVTAPSFSFGYWWVDLYLGSQAYVVQHKLGQVYGVSRIRGDETPFDTGWDVTCDTLEDLVRYFRNEGGSSTP